MNLIDLIVYPYKSSICTIPVCFSFVVRYIIAFCSLFIAIFSLRFFTLFFVPFFVFTPNLPYLSYCATLNLSTSPLAPKVG